jgi:isocitrate dehydrogenase kinase/phosphatase
LNQNTRDAALAQQIAGEIRQAFADYNEEFSEVTQRARLRFEQRDWKAGQQDAVERIELYARYVQQMADAIKVSPGDRWQDRELWKLIKAEFGQQISDYIDVEFTKTYFSSITRKIFDTVGIDPDVEFVAVDYRPMETISHTIRLNLYRMEESFPDMFRHVLEDYSYDAGWLDMSGCVRFLSRELTRHWQTLGGTASVQRIEFIRPVFYQNTRAYIVGRSIGADGRMEPLVIALKNSGDGVVVDAVLMDSRDVGILFGFTRSYIHVDLDTVADAIVFLRTIMPGKPVAEIYTVLGRAKQGKTERYRSFFRHLHGSSDKFVDAPGDKGMVMIVFTLPSYDIVFKVIRDRFAYPKTVVRRDVLNKYQLVFKHDRAGRLVDAQEFRLLRFRKQRFSADLLEELLTNASETCRIEGDKIVINHLYVERRMTPLNLFLQQAQPEEARMAVLDYGQAIRDLAASNIFPGDLLLTNFGVTRNGRVIFYDYDELCLVTDCNFRELPVPKTLEEEMQADAWFYVGDNDVFPEQFISFLGLEPDHLEIFLEAHSDLLTAAFWRDRKNHQIAGDMPELLPYRRSLTAPRAPD